MTELHQALTDIRSIRRQVAEATEFRGFGPLTLCVTAGLALVAGLLQARWIPEPVKQPEAYVGLWLTTAVVCAALIATQMLTRARRLHSGMADDLVRLAVLQFLPAGVAGAVLPFALLHAAPTMVCLLPGLWQIVFSLGVFASRRCLPKAMVLVGMWFLLSGLGCLWLGDQRALMPAMMADVYAIGMGLVAAIHFFARKETSFDAREED